MIRLRVARPCGESFDAMPGDERVRFCDRCEKAVHDLSSGTEDEARALLTDARRRGEAVCVRYAKSPEGTVRFRAARAVGMAAAVSLAACTAPVEPAPRDQPAPPAAAAQAEEDHDMGDVILDEDDRCPDEPGPNDDGCPEAPPH